MNAKDKDPCRATAEQAGKVDGFPCSECWSTETVTEENYLGLVGSCPNGHIRWIKDVAKPTHPAATQQPYGWVLTGPCGSVFIPFSHRHVVDATLQGDACTAVAVYDHAAPVSPSREVEALVEVWARMARFYYGKRDRLSSAQVEVLEDCINDLRAALAPVQEKAP